MNLNKQGAAHDADMEAQHQAMMEMEAHAVAEAQNDASREVEEYEEVSWLVFQIESAQKRLRDKGINVADFDAWLRTQCFQAPTKEAYGLAKAAWHFAQGIGVDRPEGGVGNPTEPTQSPVTTKE